jgi:hypothetical protein
LQFSGPGRSPPHWNGIVLIEGDQEVARYFADEAGADAAVAATTPTRTDARALAGAWNDISWTEMVDELDRMRHANPNQ